MFRIGISLAALAVLAGFVHHAWEDHKKKIAIKRNIHLKIMPKPGPLRPGPLKRDWYKEKI